MTNPGTFTRRQFISRTGVGAIALAAAAQPLVGQAADAALRVGIIGCGVRGGKALMQGLQALPGVRVTAVSDVYQKNFVNGYEEAGLELRGEKGTIYLDRSRLELHPESKHGVAPIELILDPDMPRGRGADGRVKDGKTGTILHLENWLDCIRTRRTPVASVASVLAPTNAAHLANLSLRQGRLIDSQAAMQQ